MGTWKTASSVVIVPVFLAACSSGSQTIDQDVPIQETHQEMPFGDTPDAVEPSTVRVPSGFDEYGGILDLPVANPDGFFRVTLSDGRWWFVTPAGHGFLSLGVNHITFEGDKSKEQGYSSFQMVNQAWYGKDAEAKDRFYQSALDLLSELGFNTVGAWSGGLIDRIAGGFVGPVPYTMTLDFAWAVTSQFDEENVPSVNGDGFPDVFHPGFAANCMAFAATMITQQFRDDPFLIGYFTDNELKWWGEGKLWPIEGVSLADGFIGLPPDAPGKKAFKDFLFQDLGYTLETLNAAWGTAYDAEEQVLALDEVADDDAHPAIAEDKAKFIGRVAETYFDAVDAALESADPNHLNLCVRFAVAAPEEVVSAARRCDVLTVNDYYTDGEELAGMFNGDAVERWKRHAVLAGEGGQPKPMLMTEFGTRAVDSGLPNGLGAGWVVDTQAQRGAYYRRVVEKLLGLEEQGTGFVLGFHWFQFSDEPKLGRFDGENGNYGWLSVEGSPYLTFQEGLSAANQWMWDFLLQGAAVVLSPPAGLETTKVEEGVRFEWDPVEGASEYRVLVSTSPAFAGLVARDEWGGAECDGPHDLVVTVTDTRMTSPEPLAAGTWFWTVSAGNPGSAIASDYSDPATFVMEASCIEGHGKESVRCFEMPPPSGPPYFDRDGTVSVATLNFSVLDMDVPDAVFIANSLGVNHPASGGEGAEVALVRHFPEPLSGSPASDRFCPAAVISTEGKVVSAATFVHVRHVTPYGKVIIDRPLDPNGVVEPFSCSFPIKSGDEPVARKIYYIDTSDPLLPADVRIEVQLH